MKNRQAYRIAYMGLFFAVAMVLNYVESAVPTSAFLPPGVKLGLSNIVTMYVMFFLGARYAVVIAVLKAGFVLLTRGFTAGVLSASGGLLSIGVMAIIIFLSHRKASYLMLSVSGAISHNIAQIVMASLITQTALIVYYLPILLVSGVLGGIATAGILKIILPKIHGIGDKWNG